jgi:hypothetical protein
MTRREFGKEVISTVSNILLLDTAFRHDLFAGTLREPAHAWLRELHTFCLDVKTGTITPLHWQAQINAFHEALALEDLSQAIDFDKCRKQLHCPDLGVGTVNPRLPRIEGIKGYAFYGRMFGMRKDRAIIPHGHKNMVSCHRVLHGSFILRQYDKLEDSPESMRIKQTIEEVVSPGSFSSISDQKNNVHWLIATTEYAYTFDVIVTDIQGAQTEIENIDIASAVPSSSGELAVKKLTVNEALKKYGKSHH